MPQNFFENWKRNRALYLVRRSKPPKNLASNTVAELGIIISVENPKEFIAFKDFYKDCQKKYGRVKSVVFNEHNYALSTLSGMVSIKRSECDFWGLPKKNNRLSNFMGTYFDILIDLDVKNYPATAWVAKHTHARLKFKRGDSEVDSYDIILTSHEDWEGIMKEVDKFIEEKD